MRCVKEAPDSERIPTPDESGVRVVGPTFEVRVKGQVVATFIDFQDAFDESNRIGFRAGAETWRVDNGVECLIQRADANALDEARREADFYGGIKSRRWISEQHAEKIARGAA